MTGGGQLFAIRLPGGRNLLSAGFYTVKDGWMFLVCFGSHEFTLRSLNLKVKP